MFGNGTSEDLAKNANMFDVRIHTLNNDSSVSQVNITVNTLEMTNITSYGVSTDKIDMTKPWYAFLVLVETGGC
jgi:hypothetical protein